MKTSVIFTVSLPMETKKEAKHFTSYCPALDIRTHGETEKIAEEYLKKTIQYFLLYCFERGALEKVLKDCGFIAMKNPLSKKPKPPLHEINIPLPFVIDQEMAKYHS